MFSQEIIRIFFLKQWISLLNSLSHTGKARDTFFRFDCCKSSEKLWGLAAQELVLRISILLLPLYLCFLSETDGFIMLQHLHRHFAAAMAQNVHILHCHWTNWAALTASFPHRGRQQPCLPSTFLTQRCALLISQAQDFNNWEVKGWSSNMP